MGKYLVPVAMVAGMADLGFAALLVGFVADYPYWWHGALALAVLGGIAPMIYAVNIRVVPVFSRRAWKNQSLLKAQVVLIFAGAWVTTAGHLDKSENLVLTGSLIALTSGLLFVANIGMLFRQEPSSPAPPLPFPSQVQVDRIAVQFTRLSAAFFLIGLMIGVINSKWQPVTGRWDLVWAHTMLVGFFLSMACGTCYHVLSRWTGRPWRSVLMIRIHLLVTVLCLPLMLIALATDRPELFRFAGPIQATALLLFLVNIGPLIVHVPAPSPAPLVIAATFLTVGLFLGAWFAGHPVMGPRLRFSHAEINVFGFTGLLVSGVAYYLVPRFAGKPLIWPRLPMVQISLLAVGVVLGAVALGLQGYQHDVDTLVLLSQVLVASGFFILAAITAATFFVKRPSANVAPMRLQQPHSRGQRSLPMAH